MSKADRIATTGWSEPAQMLAAVEQGSAFLKSLSHPTRLAILCRLIEGPAHVRHLETLLSLPQAAVSKQLARLRKAGLVACRRDGRNVVYAISDDRTARIVAMLHGEFCAAE
ncbi:MAG: putative transcriptional regulator [Rhodobacteraceae bacterium HLUCCA12]|nr:MAG: putative transcriptional regulator [Rhodobacteraceae bacterium HLUCCA12]